MIEVWFFLAVVYGHGVHVVQAGPFSSAQQCEQARTVWGNRSTGYGGQGASPCYQGVK